MMASGLYRAVPRFCTSKIAPAIFRNVPHVVGGSFDNFINFQPGWHHQVRFRMTKAKMKRRIRHKRRAAWAEKGKEIPKPPGYMPRDSLVENVIPREVVEQQIRDHDAMVKKELEERRAALLKGTPLRFQMTGLKMSDRVRRLFDMNNGNQKEVVQYQKQSGMKLFELREGDSGSTAVQVVALTSRIQQLQTHMRTHKKDQSTKRGLTKLTVRRRKLLDYMERKDFESYRRVVKSLGLSRR